MKKIRSRAVHIGSGFGQFLREEGIADEVEAVAIKRVLAWQMHQAMKKSGLTKVEMAKRMKTSRAAVDRLLDAENPAVTLDTIARAANALGASVEVRLLARAA
jgi:hypothetical protein